MKRILVIMAGVLAAFGACATGGVKRIDSNTRTDLSGYWNDTDVRLVCEALIDDCINSPRVDQAIRDNRGRPPTVIVGRFRNESDEQLDTAIIASIMEEVIFNSGKLNFVAGGQTRDALRSEREDQLINASESSASSLGKETGADFMLTGAVRTIVDRSGNQTIRTYFVNAEMTSIETGERMWMKTNSDIKKLIVRPKNKL